MPTLGSTTPISIAQQKHQEDNPLTYVSPVTIITTKPNDPQKEKKVTNIYWDEQTKEVVAEVED